MLCVFISVPESWGCFTQEAIDKFFFENALLFRKGGVG